MKTSAKFFSGVVVLAVVAVLCAAWWMSTYNSLVSKSEGVNLSWGNVQVAYQRRADLIPNLVETVRGYAKHEERVFEEVTKARSQVLALSADPATLAKLADSAEIQKQFAQAQRDLSSALSQLRVTVTVEAYPELKANEGFLRLQDQLEGSENRIAIERRNNQAAVNDYNRFIQGFITRFVANHYGYSKKPYFESDSGAEKAPKLGF